MASVGQISRTELWHRRLGHVSERGLQELGKQKLLCGDKVEQLPFCDHCVMGKARRVRFNTGQRWTKGTLDYVHSDLWGPSSTESLSGARYFMSLIDDHSRKVWTFILKSKDQAFSTFRDWKTMVETQTGRKVKRLRTDNGLEYCSTEFDSFCKQHGIVRHKTTVGTPQQNGMAERFNRTLLERVRCMLINASLPRVFWAEAVATAIYLINRCPSGAIQMKTPEEMWTGRPADYSRLRVFGCTAYAHIRQDKLEPRAEKCIFLGYPEGVKGYRLWRVDSGQKRGIISRDVVFNEHEMGYAKNTETVQSVEPSQTEVSVEVEQSGSVGSGDRVIREQTVEDHTADDIQADVDQTVEDDEIQDDHQTEPDRQDLSDYMLTRDREPRQIKVPTRFADDASLFTYAYVAASEILEEEPKTVREVRASKDHKKWWSAMEEEMKSLHANNTWTLVPKPKGAKIVGSKWVFKKKDGIPGVEPGRFKARLVAKGFTQREGIDYNEVFSSVVKHRSIRLLMAIVARFDLELEQMDVKTAFLYGTLDETIYMQQPEGFEQKDRDKFVCRLDRSLYGLKQSPRQWNKRFDDFVAKLAFTRSKYDECVYYRYQDSGHFVFLLLYVDDILLASNSTELISEIKSELSSEFDMKDLGPAKKILGIEIVRDRKKKVLKLSQEVYVRKLLKKFGMDQAKSVATPMSSQFKLSKEQSPSSKDDITAMSSIPYAEAVGSLMYDMVCTRSDIAYAVSMISRFMANPGKEHWKAVKWLFRYLVGTADRALVFGGADFRRDFSEAIEGYVDSDYAGCLDSRKSITGFVFTAYGTAVSWKGNLQGVVALSTTEAEYIALTEAVKEAMWLRGIAEELRVQTEGITIYCDNQSAIHLTRHQAHHERTKHVDVRFHFIRDVLEKHQAEVEKVGTEDNPADMITKVLPGNKFDYCLKLINHIRW